MWYVTRTARNTRRLAWADRMSAHALNGRFWRILLQKSVGDWRTRARDDTRRGGAELGHRQRPPLARLPREASVHFGADPCRNPLALLAPTSDLHLSPSGERSRAQLAGEGVSEIRKKRPSSVFLACPRDAFIGQVQGTIFIRWPVGT